MENLHCNRCGEEYSSTYRKCPFCQEAAAERRGRPMYRSGRRLSKRQRSAGAGGVLKLVILSAALIIGVTFVFSDEIASFLGIRTDSSLIEPDNVQTDPDSSVSNDTPAPDESEDPDIGSTGDVGESPDEPVVPDDPGTDDEPDTGSDDPAPPAAPLTLSHSVITIPSGETARISVSGGSGSVTWSSSNTEIATVEDGAVTGVAGGTVTVTAKSGDETATCTVTITGDPWVSPVELSLNRTDFTLAAGDPPFQLKVKGTENAVTWSSSNTNVATVDSTGLVKRVAKGNATITAKVDGQTLTCIVRVP